MPFVTYVSAGPLQDAEWERIAREVTQIVALCAGVGVQKVHMFADEGEEAGVTVQAVANGDRVPGRIARALTEAGYGPVVVQGYRPERTARGGRVREAAQG